jgi:hypothetical protein
VELVVQTSGGTSVGSIERIRAVEYALGVQPDPLLRAAVEMLVVVSLVGATAAAHHGDAKALFAEYFACDCRYIV